MYILLDRLKEFHKEQFYLKVGTDLKKENTWELLKSNRIYVSVPVPCHTDL